MAAATVVESHKRPLYEEEKWVTKRGRRESGIPAPSEEKKEEEDDKDVSFLALIESFAALGSSEDRAETLLSVEETCPLCQFKMTLGKFATHVYQCVDERYVADQVEQVGGGTAAQLDALYRYEECKLTLTLPCVAGRDCRNLDATHFMRFRHPPALCPCCNQEYPVFEIDVHVTFCLVRTSHPFSSSQDKATSTVVGESKGTGESKEEKKDKKLLSTRQLWSMACVIQAKASKRGVVKKSSESGKLEDASLTQLLDGFKKLGFTREAVENAVDRGTLDPGCTTASSTTSISSVSLPLPTLVTISTHLPSSALSSSSSAASSSSPP